MTIKANDVFHFQWNKKYYEEHRDPNWCFDGQLVARETPNKSLLLVDTYWCSGSDNISFTPEEAEAKGTLTFVCNLDDVTDCHEDVTMYYDQKDWFNLSYQHGCYKRYVLKKGAQRSQKQMILSIQEKIDDTTRKIRWMEDDLKAAQQTLERITRGELDVAYI